MRDSDICRNMLNLLLLRWRNLNDKAVEKRYNVLLARLTVGGIELRGRWVASQGTVKKYKQRLESWKKRLAEYKEKVKSLTHDNEKLNRRRKFLFRRHKLELKESCRLQRESNERLKHIRELEITNRDLVRADSNVSIDSGKKIVYTSEWDEISARAEKLEKEINELQFLLSSKEGM